MISFSKHTRSTQDEIMDDFTLQGKEMETLLVDLKRVNTLLGGIHITINGIKKLLKGHPKDTPIHIADIGCGDGEVLRSCAVWGKKNGYTFVLVGIDGNPHILEVAKVKSISFPNISYKQFDVFSNDLDAMNVDICTCTLFLHHFKKEQIITILNRLQCSARLGTVVNDLHRSRLAFQLFKVFSRIFIRTHIAKHDGLVSVARGFRINDIQSMSDALPNANHTIIWKWAFRYQWILKRTYST